MFTKLRLPCQVLVNNAGASLLPRTEDGLEGVFVVNYLSHVYLTLVRGMHHVGLETTPFLCS